MQNKFISQKNWQLKIIMICKSFKLLFDTSTIKNKVLQNLYRKINLEETRKVLEELLV